MSFNKIFTRIANKVSSAAGRPAAFILCCAVVVIWAVSGPVFDYSDTWQLIINTGTTIVTFLMVFLIQNTQNRDGAAIQAKLDELIRASSAANIFIGIEHLTEDEVEEFRTRCEHAAAAHGAREEVAKAKDVEAKADAAAKAHPARRVAGGKPAAKKPARRKQTQA